jgi:hypothetical protein
MGKRRGMYRDLVRKLRERNHPGVDGRIQLRWNFTKWYVEVWSGPSWLRIGTGGRHLCFGSETSGSIKCGEFLDYLKICYFLKKDSAP